MRPSQSFGRKAGPITLVALVILVAAGTELSASADNGSPRERLSAPGQISLMWPIDFSTGAVPSSAASNAAAGDQALLLPPKLSLSDSVAVGDFNRDGNSDVAQTNVNAGTVSILLGDGDAGFAPARAYPVGAHPSFVVAGKLDLDEHLDLAVADFGSGDVAILLGNGEGTFQPATFLSVSSPRGIGIGDFNGDDLSDLAVASSIPVPSYTPPTGYLPTSPTGGVTILMGIGNGTFAPTQSITYTYPNDAAPINANTVAVGDFDGGGFDDLAVGVGYSRSAGALREGDTQPTGDDVLIFLNRNQVPAPVATQPFGTAPSQSPIRVGASPDAMALSDLNGDAHPDLAVAGNASGDISTLLGDQDGHFVLKARNVTVGPLPRSVTAADLNGDGVQDLVTGNFSSSTVSVLEGNGEGTFQPAVEFWSGDSTTSAAIGHFDGDGRLDVVAGRLRNDHLALLINDSPQQGDGVVITRDIPYGSPTHPGYDPWVEDHALDVYSPPRGTASFAGRGRPYPVLYFLHGGGYVSGDKTMVTYLLRSLAREGIIGISANYRLGLDATVEDMTKDAAQAFRWVHANIGSRAYGGDLNNIFVSGHSAGSILAGKLGTETSWMAEQQNIRGLVLVSLCHLGPELVKPAPTQRPSLLVTGDEGLDGAKCDRDSEKFSNESRALGAESEHVTTAGRDHMTVLSDIALNGDPGRVAMLKFMKERLRRVSFSELGQRCLARRAPIGPRSIGRIRLGYSRRRLLRIRVSPRSRGRRAYRYCVKRSRGRVVAVFGPRGRVRLVTTTAPAHRMRRTGRGSSVGRLHRAFPHGHQLTPGIFRAGPRSRRIFGTRRGRVHFVAVADRRLLADPRTLRRYLRRAGL